MGLGKLIYFKGISSCLRNSGHGGGKDTLIAGGGFGSLEGRATIKDSCVVLQGKKASGK